MSVPLVEAAFLNFASDSTLTPVRWLMSYIASPVSIVFFTSAVSPPTVATGAKAPSAPPSGPTLLVSVCAAPSTCFSFPPNAATDSLPVTAALIRSNASMFMAISASPC